MSDRYPWPSQVENPQHTGSRDPHPPSPYFDLALGLIRIQAAEALRNGASRALHGSHCRAGDYPQPLTLSDAIDLLAEGCEILVAALFHQMLLGCDADRAALTLLREQAWDLERSRETLLNLVQVGGL